MRRLKMRSKLVTLSVFILAITSSGCSKSAERTSLAGMDVACTVQMEGGGSPHQRFKTEGYLTNAGDGYLTLSGRPEPYSQDARPASGSFRIPAEMFENRKSDKDFRVRTADGGTASYNDRVEVTFDSFHDPKTDKCTYTIEEIRKL
jgi:hypothetical protein